MCREPNQIPALQCVDLCNKKHVLCVTNLPNCFNTVDAQSQETNYWIKNGAIQVKSSALHVSCGQSECKCYNGRFMQSVYFIICHTGSATLDRAVPLLVRLIVEF